MKDCELPPVSALIFALVLLTLFVIFSYGKEGAVLFDGGDYYCCCACGDCDGYEFCDYSAVG